VNIAGGKFYQNTSISVTPACVISGGQFGDDTVFMGWNPSTGKDDDPFVSPVGRANITSGESVTLTGDVWFTRDVVVTAPKVLISGGRFGWRWDKYAVKRDIHIRSEDATISGGTFDHYRVFAGSDMPGDYPPIVVTGGRFSFNPAGCSDLSIPSNKKVVQVDGYYTVVDK
jgi:hypothetical protein